MTLPGYVLTARSVFWSDFPAGDSPAKRAQVRRHLFCELLELHTSCMWLMQVIGWKQKWLASGALPDNKLIGPRAIEETWELVDAALENKLG